MKSLNFHQLDFENFKSFYGYHSFKLDRPAGLYYISGDNQLNPELGANGCGKTGLWDAFIWCQTGKTGRDNRPANAVVPWDLKKGTTTVQLEFSRGKKKQLLHRSRNPNELKLDGKTVTQAEVDAALGLNEEMCRRTIVLGQFGRLFLDLRPEEQSQMFNEALNLNLWLRASTSASQRQKSLTGQLVGTRVELSKIAGRQTELQTQLAKEEEAKNNFAANLQQQRQQIEKQLQRHENKLKQFLADYPVPGSAGAPVARKNGPAAISTREAAISTLENAWSRLGREAGDLKVEVDAIASDIKTSQVELKQYTAAINGNKACPACGQTAPLAHLKAKAKQCENAIAEKQALHTNASKLLFVKVSGAEESNRIVKEQRTLLREQETLESDVSLAKRELARFAEQDNPHETAIKDLQKRLRKLGTDQAALEQQQADLTYKAGAAEYWVGAFKEIRLSLIDEALLELEMAVTGHAEALGLPGWQIKFATERVKASGDVSTAFTVMLHPPEQEEEPIKFESYSGGESQRLQLATSFGLSEVILARAGVNPNLEVLDEPTRGLSPEGVNDLLEHLAQRAKDLDRAIYVTEHHSLERGMFRRMITVIKDTHGSHIAEE